MTDNQKFIDLYNHLEESIRKEFELDDDKKPVAFLEQQENYRYIKSELKYCREVRNIISHKKRLGNEYPITVNPGMVEFIKDNWSRLKDNWSYSKNN